MAAAIKLGLLGNGIGRSRAKNLHELLGEMHGLEVSYTPMDLAQQPQPVNIADELQRCREQGFRGVNVTHPYKRDAFQHVQTIKGFPTGLTAINTALFDEDMTRATNTDFSGFCRAYQRQFGEEKPGRVLMLGSGGVGLAMAFAMQALGASELVLHDTQSGAVDALCQQLEGGSMQVRAAEAVLVAEMRQADGLMNATPLGMFQYPGSAFPNDGYAGQRWAFDAVYTPEQTEFMQACRNHDIETLSGFKLFLYQGLDAFLHFTGIEADEQQTEQQFLSRYPLS